MKIELEFKDLDEFSEFMCAMNNATAAYQRVINSIILGVDFPSIFDKLAETKTEEELKARLALLISKYNDLEEIEKYLLEPEIWKRIKEKEIS
jgi:hypothetical protein